MSKAFIIKNAREEAERRHRRSGKAYLACLEEYARENGFGTWSAMRAAHHRYETSPRATSDLTVPELTCVALMSQGLSYRAIAGAMGISQRTVRHHLREASRRFGVKRRRELPLRVLIEGFLPDAEPPHALLQNRPSAADKYEQWIRTCEAGRGLVLVTGKPGSGRSRIITETVSLLAARGLKAEVVHEPFSELQLQGALDRARDHLVIVEVSGSHVDEALLRVLEILRFDPSVEQVYRGGIVQQQVVLDSGTYLQNAVLPYP
jgi:DNA-binding CsgD family transcriptional regulator